jgi:hypothetical protein
MYEPSELANAYVPPPAIPVTWECSSSKVQVEMTVGVPLVAGVMAFKGYSVAFVHPPCARTWLESPSPVNKSALANACRVRVMLV